MAVAADSGHPWGGLGLDPVAGEADEHDHD